MVEKPTEVHISSLLASDLCLVSVKPTHSRSLPDLPNVHESNPKENSSRRFLKRVYTSTHRIPGPHALIISPIGPRNNNLTGKGCIFGGRVLTLPGACESYITAHVKIITEFSRVHEYEDLLTTNNPIREPSSVDFFYFPKRPQTRTEIETANTSVGLSSILPAQGQDVSFTLPSVEDLTLTKEEDTKKNMAIPAQYAVEHQTTNREDVVHVMTQRTASVNELRRRFEDAQTMYLPRDSNMLKLQTALIKKSHSTDQLRSRPRSAAFEYFIHQPSRPRTSQPVPRKQQNIPIRSSSMHDKRYPLRQEALSLPDQEGDYYRSYSPPKQVEGFSPTGRRLSGVDRSASPRTMNRAAGGNAWPDGIYTKTGDVYKRANNVGLPYIVPTFTDAKLRPSSPEFRRDHLSVDCSETHGWQTRMLPKFKQRPSPVLSSSYLEHIKGDGPSPYRSVPLSNFIGIQGRRRSASCQNLWLCENPPLKPQYHKFPRAVNDGSWKARGPESSACRRRMHTNRGSWSPAHPYTLSPPGQSIPGNLQALTGGDARNLVNADTLPSPQLPPPPSATIDDSSISKAFRSSVAFFEKWAQQNQRDTQKSQCLECPQCSCVHPQTAGQGFPSRRLFSAHRTQSDRDYLNGDTRQQLALARPIKYSFERGAYNNRCYGDGFVEVISSPGGRTFS